AGGARAGPIALDRRCARSGTGGRRGPSSRTRFDMPARSPLATVRHIGRRWGLSWSEGPRGPAGESPFGPMPPCRAAWSPGPRMSDTSDTNNRTDLPPARGGGRRPLLGVLGAARGGVGAALAAPAVGNALASLGSAHATPEPVASGHDRIPPDARPGGAYDRY